MNDFHKDEAWYRNPWVWLVIAIPSLTVAGCMLTMYLALTHPQILVNDNAPAGATTTGSSRPGTD